MLFRNLSDKDYISMHFVADWEYEEGCIHINHRQRMLSFMETTDLSRLAFIAEREGNISMKENLERELRGRRYQNKDSVDIPTLRASVDILDLIESHTGGLRWKKGGLVKCPLPDHKDGTASFSINREKGFFICFGCGKKGSIIDFVMEYNKVSLSEAINKLKAYI